MSEQLSYEEFLVLAKTAKRVAVHKEILMDRLTPIVIAERLHEELRDGAILESGLHQEDTGHYSFITFGSMAQLSVENNIITQRVGTKTSTHTTHPFKILRQLIAELACVGKKQKVDFVSGGVGFFTYDAIRLFETIPDRHMADHPLPQMLFNFYETTLMFDHKQQKLLVSQIVEIGDDPKKDYQLTQEKMNALITKMMTTTEHTKTYVNDHAQVDPEVVVDINDGAFMSLVEQAKKYIVSGDAFQIVLSRCFKKKYTVSPFDIYRALRRVSPAPYMFYLPINNTVIVGASPERLISVQNRKVSINPIAGTRKRHEKSDEQISSELLNDKKEVAEHMMLVDLARNDLGVVCEPGSVEIHELLKIRHFSHVSHLTSVLSGKLRENLDAFDALTAAFPAGTLSGAPKIRAMQLIDELETTKRGMYGGAICRLDYQGNLDSCIAIRMASLTDGVATVRTGAGIIYDSNPEAEANETRQKAQGILEAIAFAQEELK